MYFGNHPKQKNLQDISVGWKEDKWEVVVAYLDPQEVSEPQHTFVMSDNLGKEIDEQVQT
jgi:hypothetical protein